MHELRKVFKSTLGRGNHNSGSVGKRFTLGEKTELKRISKKRSDENEPDRGGGLQYPREKKKKKWGRARNH